MRVLVLAIIVAVVATQINPDPRNKYAVLGLAAASLVLIVLGLLTGERHDCHRC